MSAVACLSDATLTYRGAERPSIEGISMRLDEGDRVGIVGASGSGKSTLLNVLGLLDSPTSGSYMLRGRELAGASDARRAVVRARQIGFVFQAFHLLPTMSLVDNVALGGRYAGMRERDRLRRAQILLDAVGLGDRAGARPNELSGGEQQRVALARALVRSPRLVLADEPTGNLDRATTEHVLAVMDEVVGRASALVVVTHDPRVAARMNRVLRLDAGRVVDDASPDGSGE